MPLLQYQSIAFVPLVTVVVPPVFVQGQNCEPVHQQSFQYESTAEPVLVPAAPAGPVSSDKWAQPQSVPIKGHQFRVGDSVLVFDRWTHVPTVYISGASPAPIHTQSFQYPSEAKPVVTTVTPETVTFDKWRSLWPDPYFRLKRLVQYGVNTAIGGQADDGLPPTWWQLNASQPTFIKPRLRVNGISVSTTTTPAPATTAVYVQGSQPGPISVVSFQYPSIVGERLHVVPDVLFVPPDRWQRAPVIARRQQRSADYSQFAIDPTPRAERASLDKWGQPVERPVFDTGRTRRIYPSLVFDRPLAGVEIVTFDKWHSQRVERIDRARRLDYSGFAIDTRLLTQSEQAQVDKWRPPQSPPRWDLKRQQHVYPALAIDSRFYLIPPVEIIRLDQWNRQSPELIFRTKRPFDYGQLAIDPTPQGEHVSIDKWVTGEVQPRVLRSRFTQPDHLIFVSETLTIDKWIVAPGQPRLPRTRFIQLEGGVLFVPETLTVDKWVLATQQPRSFARRPVEAQSTEILLTDLPTLDKWLNTADIQRRPQVRIYPANDLLLTEISSVLLFQQPDQPSFVVRRAQSQQAEVFAELRFEQWRDLVQPFMPRDVTRSQYLYLWAVIGLDLSATLHAAVVIKVPPDNRTVKIKADSRTIIVPVDNRTIDV